MFSIVRDFIGPVVEASGAMFRPKRRATSLKIGSAPRASVRYAADFPVTIVLSLGYISEGWGVAGSARDYRGLAKALRMGLIAEWEYRQLVAFGGLKLLKADPGYARFVSTEWQCRSSRPGQEYRRLEELLAARTREIVYRANGWPIYI